MIVIMMITINTFIYNNYNKKKQLKNKFMTQSQGKLKLLNKKSLKLKENLIE